MATGRKTGGRQKGTPNKVTQEQMTAMAASGLAPLDYMLQVMRDGNQPPERRDEMAKAAAPYVHARLTSTELKGEVKHNYVARMPAPVKGMDEWQNRYSPSPTTPPVPTTKQ